MIPSHHHDVLRAGRALALALVLACASPARALPLISEVVYDATGSDDGHVFVEIFASPGSSLDGFVLEGVNGANGEADTPVALAGVVPADGLFVVADRTGGGISFVAGWDLLANFDFQNGPDSIVLRGPGGVVDALGYGDFDPGEVFAGEGTPAPDAPAGTSLARRFANLDTDDNAADFVVLDVPTPGSAPIEVPEPGRAGLLLLGAGGLAALRRG